jgi:type I restriction enzyme M protein
MSPARTKATEPQTTQARLSAVIKESRNIMRKDAGLNGELDRLPQMAWLLFLKAFDDLEEQHAVQQRHYTPILDENLRWSNWAGSHSRTGEALLTFVNGTLLPELRTLKGTGKATDPRDTLARVFQDVQNRMLSGHLLRELVDQLDKVQFTSSDDIHTMAHLYESMLREMRDAAGDSGEFYTPRPLVRFIVDRIDPKPGERVLDPAAGTGGFLVQSFEHMTASNDLTAAQLKAAREGIRGIEKKPLPYLLCLMNLLLHGIDRPDVVESNALAFSLAEMKRNGVDVVITNPPFGGEEEGSILANFPSDRRTAETVWLFLQAVMARLEHSRTGRCAIVVPNSVLFDQGAGARIKADLMSRFNLHTVLRLPNGVFAPYTLIPSNVLFFEKGTQQPEVWFYEHPMPAGRKNYTKTKPLRYEEFAGCEAWWGGGSREGREENEHAWKVAAADIASNRHNLDLRNPHRPDDLTHRPPAELVAELVETEREILGLLEELQRDIKDFSA